MHPKISVSAPNYGPMDRRRDAQRHKIAAQAVRELMVQMVQSGWRESEAALSLADAFDDYCVYLAQHPSAAPKPANSNVFSASAARENDRPTNGRP